MSQENVEAFKRGLEAGNRGDVEGLLEVLDPEVEWHTALHALLAGDATVYRGHAGVREMLRDMYEAFDEIQIEVPEIRDLGDRLVARSIWQGAGHGPESSIALTGVYTVRKGRIVAIEFFLDHAEALEILGLSESADVAGERRADPHGT